MFEVEVNFSQTVDGRVDEIIVGEQKIKATVAASGSYTTAKAPIAGAHNFAKPGRYTLAFKPVSKPGAVVMTLWNVNLVPVKK